MIRKKSINGGNSISMSSYQRVFYERHVFI
jgi:hypothetical protein